MGQHLSALMSKRKLPELVPEGKAAGKQRLLTEEDVANEMLLGEMLGGLSEGEQELAVDAVVQDVNGVESVNGDYLDADIMLAGLADEQGAEEANLPPRLPDLPDLPIGELPAELDEAALISGQELDLSNISVTAAQARKMAPLIGSNSELNVIKFPQHELMISEIREEDELEWDSEEYTDVEAIFIAEFLKHTTALKRLDLARNQIGDDGAMALAAAVGVNPTIEYLNLESNNLSGTAGAAFCRAVEENASLQYLNLMYNALPTTAQQILRDSWAKNRPAIGLHL